jgi:hypothetical protein
MQCLFGKQYFDVSQDWNRFLKHLSSFNLCVLPDAAGNSSRSVDEEQSDVFGNVSIAVTASLSLVQQLSSLPHNITVTGFLPLGGLHFSSSHMLQILYGSASTENFQICAVVG